jgi:hypothetical protein
MREPLSNEALHPVLAELPEFAPSAELWTRIEKAHANARGTRRPQRWLAIAATVAVIVGAITLFPREQRASNLSEGQRESQSLEREWQALALAPSGTRPTAGLARLHVIDAALQSAYDRGARADELQPLWKERNAALRGLILTAGTESVTRI